MTLSKLTEKNILAHVYQYLNNISRKGRKKKTITSDNKRNALNVINGMRKIKTDRKMTPSI